MKKTAIILAMLAACVHLAHAGDTRTLERQLSSSALKTIELDSGVGEVAITGRDDADTISIEVVLTPRRGGFFSSKRHAEREVAEASLRAEVVGTTLEVRLDPDSDDRRFEEDWTIELPASMFVHLDHGVGNVVLRGVAGGLEVDSGVGDILAEIEAGDVTIDLGVGQAVIRALAELAASATGSSGVGSARLEVTGEKIESSGFVSRSASWTGNGTFHIEVEVGVGDAIIELE